MEGRLFFARKLISRFRKVVNCQLNGNAIIYEVVCMGYMYFVQNSIFFFPFFPIVTILRADHDGDGEMGNVS